ncbi:hypothetical protein BC940DRAFT_314047 [Gongronella butleri]|nr:hypothetical protein BC940DRAFT_314047 [Gongronella butleri]
MQPKVHCLNPFMCLLSCLLEGEHNTGCHIRPQMRPSALVDTIGARRLPKSMIIGAHTRFLCCQHVFTDIILAF